jgi:N-acetylmuramoyl-L-alanine amidase
MLILLTFPTTNPFIVTGPEKQLQSSTINNDRTDSNEMIYKVQISASTRKLDLVPSNFKGLHNLSVVTDNGLYKYLYGETTDLDQAKHYVEQAKEKGFPTSFIVGFKDGKLIKL